VKHTTYLSSLFCLSALLPVAAEETIVTLAPTTVTADEGSEEEQGAITNEDLTKRSATDLNDVFQKTPSVTVNGGRNQAQQIFVNGLESNLSNVTIDGAKQGNIFHHAGTVFVEPELELPEKVPKRDFQFFLKIGNTVMILERKLVSICLTNNSLLKASLSL